jgi:DNA-binding beta-propeller fold protein YncE
LLIALIATGNSCIGQKSEDRTNNAPFATRVPAPSLDGDFAWLNTDRPLGLTDFRGKFVLLDFWTFCCINCIHVLPELQTLEHNYAGQLVVVGVHSAKFDAEKKLENIRDAVLRYDIEHPVVNDSEMTIWERYGVRSWPTLVLIDPEGKAVWLGEGERKSEEIAAILDRAIPYYREKGLLNEQPLHFALERDRVLPTPLRFPGKVLADPEAGRIFIADSNHHRIVVADLAGKLIDVIGRGARGQEDGGYETCSFNQPQGMAISGTNLYVADTSNHLIRKIDLRKKEVTTIAGIGEQGRGWPQQTAPRKTALNSPWALWIHDHDLYIAMAGSHQIWSMPLNESKIGIYAGNGVEDIVDGLIGASRFGQSAYAAFAQPSGLTSDGRQLFVADSEGSAIRAIQFNPSGRVETIVGPTGSLFDFGDVDGPGRRARLQHPLGIAYDGGKLFIADAYNNKIKVLDLSDGICHTFAGTGQPGKQDASKGSEAQFDEPGGLSAAGGKLYVADTNNHTIRVIDLGADAPVTTLTITGLTPPNPSARQ